MLMQSDDDEAVPADPSQWLYAVTKHEPSPNDLLVDSVAATEVCQQSLADSLGGKPSGPFIGHWTSRTRDGTNVAGDIQIDLKKTGRQRVHHLSWSSVRQRQHHHSPQHWWNDAQRVLW